MKKKKHNIPFNNSQRIFHILMLQSSLLIDVGLYEGKMGIAVAFAELFKHTSNKVYDDYMGDLLDDILENINKGLNFNFKSGLSGIGWGIEYLIQNKFVEGESIEVCEDIDNKIMETDPKRITDFSLETGFEGLSLYIVYHLQGAIKQGTKLPFDNTYLSDIYFVCTSLNSKIISNSLNALSNLYVSFIENKAISNYGWQPINFATNVPKIDFDKLTTYPLGLNNGIA